MANENKEVNDAPYVVRPSSPFSYPSHYSYVAEDLIDRENRLKPALDLEDRERMNQYACKEGEKTYAPYTITPEPSSLCFYERGKWDEDLDPDLTDLLEVQFEPEQETDPSQSWLDMEGKEDIPLDLNMELSSPSIFEPDDPVFHMDW